MTAERICSMLFFNDKLFFAYLLKNSSEQTNQIAKHTAKGKHDVLKIVDCKQRKIW